MVLFPKLFIFPGIAKNQLPHPVILKHYQTVYVPGWPFQDTQHNVTRKLTLGHLWSLLHPGLLIPEATVHCAPPPSTVPHHPLSCHGLSLIGRKSLTNHCVHHGLCCSCCGSSFNCCHPLICCHSLSSFCYCLVPVSIHDLPFIIWFKVIHHHVFSSTC